MKSSLICFAFALLFSREWMVEGNTFTEQVVFNFENGGDDAVEALNTGNAKPTFSSNTLSHGSGPPNWIITPKFGVDRHYDKLEPSSSSNSVKELEFFQTDLTSGNIFLQVLWLGNENRQFETVFHEVQSNGLSGIAETSLNPNITISLSSGSTNCTLVSRGSNAADTNSFPIYNFQFAVYASDFYEPPSFEQTSVVEGNLQTSTFQVHSAPSRLAIGYLHIAKSIGSTTLTESVINDILEAVGPDFCSELANSTFFCCDPNKDGVPGTVVEETCVNCSSDYFGPCCDKGCNNGEVETLSPYGTKICHCDSNWGGEECDQAGLSEHFVAMMKYNAEQCQSEVSNHLAYSYFAAGGGDLETIFEPFNGLEESNNVSFGIDGTLSNVVYGESSTSSPLVAVSDETNDFLFAASIDKPLNHTGYFSIQVEHELDSSANFDAAETYSGSLTLQYCVVMYDIIQRFGSSASGALAEIFFVIGRERYSTLPSSTTLTSVNTSDTFVEVTDTWKVIGTSMTGLIMGYNLVAKDGPNDIPQAELLAVLNCYAQVACDSLPPAGIECRFGTVTNTTEGPQCICDPGWIGVKCNLPLCPGG